VEKRNAYKIFWGTSWTVAVWIFKKEMENDIKMYLRETGCKDGRRMELPQNGV
jgi:hypothetical protein